MRFNPYKCAFRVSLEKLLGYVVSLREIKVDNFKIKDNIRNATTSNRGRDRGFMEQLRYISRFIEPIFKKFKKGGKIKGDQEFAEAFHKIKEYSSKPQIMVTP